MLMVLVGEHYDRAGVRSEMMSAISVGMFCMFKVKHVICAPCLLRASSHMTHLVHIVGLCWWKTAINTTDTGVLYIHINATCVLWV